MVVCVIPLLFSILIFFAGPYYSMSKLVRIDAETYRGLTCYAGRLQSRLGKPVSLNAALGYLVAKAQAKTPGYIRLLRQKKSSAGRPKKAVPKKKASQKAKPKSKKKK
ncbi:MAG: hypothetical protein WC408_04130 [Candidatus Micrarchaeia archaeon]